MKDRIIKPGIGVPWAGGIQHEAADQITTKCGLTIEDKDRFAPTAAVWTVLCDDCYQDQGILRFLLPRKPASPGII